MKATAVIYNAAAGGGNDLKIDIEVAFGAASNQLTFFDIGLATNKLASEISAKDIQQVVAAGGDGTVNCAANIAIKLNLPLGVLPIGTLNHFAKDVGIPLALEAAARTIQEGDAQKLDYCTINDHVFVNNSSIGIYPSTVLQRQKLEPKTGKWLGAFIASVGVLIRLSATHLQFIFEGKKLVFKTPMVFVGNGSYRPEEIGFTNRKSLSEGKLFLYVVRSNRVTGILSLTILAFAGKRPKNKDYIAHIAADLTINSRKPVVDVAVDGEVISLQPPLLYQMHSSSLSVILPAS